MNCHEVRSKWQAYVNGDSTPEEERQIEEHLQACPHCQPLLDQDLEKQEDVQFINKHLKREDAVNDLPIKKQNRLIRRAKWKNRLMNALTVFGLFILLSMISGFLTSIYYGFGSESSRGQQATQVVRTATQMTMPNVYATSGGFNTNFFFNMDIDYYLQKKVGKQDKMIGQLDGKMLFHRLTVNREWTDGQFNVQLYFLHPQFVANQPEAEQEFYERTKNETWRTLDILPEGTVSEVALTFDRLYDIDEVYSLLHGYDLEIPWYAIDTGTEKEGDSYGSPYLSAGNGIWGIHEGSIFDFKRGGGSIQVRGDGDEREEAFKTGLRFLADHENMVKQYVWDVDRHHSLEERYDYVEENGVKTYGVVVTGPTKELLRLQEHENIIYATVGEVDYWNWYDRPASGTIYN